MTLLTAPLELAGAWRGSAPTDAAAIIERMRAACLSGLALLSDRQPEALRVEDHADGPPAIWLHSDPPTTGWIIVDVGARDWCNLAYQFGHELGHVLSNSWTPDAAPRNPCQWIEEACVEAFSLRGLGLLADAWERAPPFPNDGAYAASIRSYRDTILGRYRDAAREQGEEAGFGAWFTAHEAFLGDHGGVGDARGAVSTVFGVLEEHAAWVADLGALNRWPGRSGIPLADYLAHWQASCAELGAPGGLPARLRDLLAGP